MHPLLDSFRAGAPFTKVARVLATIGLLVTVGGGSWWTAQAVLAGDLGSMFLRLAISVSVGFYYLAMLRISQGRSVGFGYAD